MIGGIYKFFHFIMLYATYNFTFWTYALIFLIVLVAIYAFMSSETLDTVLLRIHQLSNISDINKKEEKYLIYVLNKYPKMINTPLFSKGYTPFLRACGNNNYNLASFMLQKGAAINAVTIDGDTPLYITAHNIAQNQSDDYRLLKLLHEKGCNVNAKKIRGHTVLHIAAKYGDIDLARWLLLRGADPEIKALGGFCPADVAKLYGNSEVESLLRVKKD